MVYIAENVSQFVVRFSVTLFSKYLLCYSEKHMVIIMNNSFHALRCFQSPIAC